MTKYLVNNEQQTTAAAMSTRRGSINLLVHRCRYQNKIIKYP